MNALRHFEAAARHSSFVKASAELCVTPGAVSQQVRQLEDWLGRPLFVRHAHGVSLTPEAEAAAKHLQTAFDAVGGAVQMLRSACVPDQIRIAALPSIAQLWLPQRLSQLKQQFSDLEISVAAVEVPPDFSRDPYHFGIFFLEPAVAPSNAIWLQEDTLFPVCSPDLAISNPEDLEHQTLLHDGTWKKHWSIWLKQAGFRDLGRRGPVFSLYSIALQTAVDGGGVLMGRGALVAKELQSGRLVQPFELELKAPDRLALIVPSTNIFGPRQRLFIEAFRCLPA